MRMKSKKVFAVVSVFILAITLMLPFYVPTVSAQAMPEFPEYIHLHMMGPQPPIEEPYVCSQWHELYPNFSRQYHLENLIDSGWPSPNGVADVCEQIALREKGEECGRPLKWKWYHVEWITVTIKVEYKAEIMYLEFNGTKEDWLIAGQFTPVFTLWHEVWPVFSNKYQIVGWIDTGLSLVLDASDWILLVDLDTGLEREWHVDEVCCDMVVSLNPPRCAITSHGTFFYVSPNLTNIVEPVCIDFPIEIWVENAPESYAWEIKLSWDNTVLAITSITEGPWLAGAGPTVFTATPLAAAQAQGWLGAGCTLRGIVSPGASGDGLLCTITFHVMAPGRSKLDLYDTFLGGMPMGWDRKDYPNNDGFFCEITSTTCLHDVAIIDVTHNATGPVTPGDLVGIDVTVVNQGEHPQHMVVKVYADSQDVYDPEDPDIVLIDEIVIGHYDCLELIPGATQTLHFVWDTTGVPSDAWTISAEVIKTDAPDDDPNDNLFIDCTVHVKCDHDLRIQKIIIWAPKPPRVVEGGTVTIYVYVENQGQNTEGPFNVRAFADLEAPYKDEILIDEQTVLSLDSQETTILTFHWDTTCLPGGTYTISADVDIVPLECETCDNNLTDGTVEVMVYDLVAVRFEVMTRVVRYGSRVVVRFAIKNEGTEDVSAVIVRIYANMCCSYYCAKYGKLPKNDSIYYDYPAGYLSDGETKEYCIIWPTQGFVIAPELFPGLYNMSIYVIAVRGEKYIYNNYYPRLCPPAPVSPTYEKLLVVSACDLNGDCRVDIGDVGIAKRCYSSAYPFTCPNWEPPNPCECEDP